MFKMSKLADDQYWGHTVEDYKKPRFHREIQRRIITKRKQRNPSSTPFLKGDRSKVKVKVKLTQHTDYTNKYVGQYI